MMLRFLRFLFRLFRKFLAIILGLIFLNLIFLGGIVFGLTQTYFNPHFYQGEFVENLREKGIHLLVQTLYQKNEIFENYFTPEEIEAEIKNLVTTAFLESTFARLFEQAKQDPLPAQLVFSLQEIKTGFPQAVDRLLENFIGRLPPCSSSYLKYDASSIPSCLPLGMSSGYLKSLFHSQIDQSVFDYVPAEVTLPLGEILASHPEIAPYLSIKIWHIQVIILGILFFLLAFIALLIFKPLKQVIHFIATLIFLGGAELLSFKLIYLSFLDQIKEILASSKTGFSSELSNFVCYFIEVLIQRIFLYGLILAGLGGVAIILSFFAKKKR